MGWANLPAERAGIGTAFIVNTVPSERQAAVCTAPWFRPQTKMNWGQ